MEQQHLSYNPLLKSVLWVTGQLVETAALCNDPSWSGQLLCAMTLEPWTWHPPPPRVLQTPEDKAPGPRPAHAASA